MPKSNTQIVKDASINTASISSGLLNPEQSKTFLQQVFDATPLGSLVRHEMRRSKSGVIDKIGIASRILRKKTEGTDDGYRAGVKTSQVEYNTTAVRLPWEITGETLRQNIEGASFEQTVTNLMTKQLSVDLEDLYLNGDESKGDIPAFSASTAYAKGDLCLYEGKLYEFTAAHAAGAWSASDVSEVGTSGDVDFLKINDGWIKQIKTAGHVYDASTESGMSLDLFYKAVAQIPNKYNDGTLRWLMSPHRAQEWELFLLNQVVTKGGAVPDTVYSSPVGIPVVSCPKMSDDTILLTAPSNLAVVNTYDVQIRKTDEGRDAIMKDMIYYAVHLDFDPIIEETDATAIITGLK